MLSARGDFLVSLTLLAVLVVVSAQGRLFVSDRDQMTKPSDSDIMKLVQAYTSEGDLTALDKLRVIPRAELHRALKRIRNSVRQDDAMRVKAAFVSCLMGFDYNSNVQVVSSSLTKKPKYKEFWADDAAGLISRLLDTKKDASLLKVLFASIDFADGALSETLAESFTKQAQQDTMRFLTNLRTQPEPRRRKVYRLFNGSSMSGQDMKALREHLSSIHKKSPLGPTAREMLKAIS